MTQGIIYHEPLLGLTLPEPVASTSFQFDATGGYSSITHRQGSSPTGTLLAGYGYTYDPGSRLTALDFLPDGSNSPFDRSAEDAVYTYDQQNQLDAANYNGGAAEENYQYDANGVRIGGQLIAGATQTYAPGAGGNNRLNSNGVFNYVYDNEGNRTSKTRSATEFATDKVTEYAWDHRNRLTKVTVKDSNGAVTKTVDYQYDGFNQMVRRVVDADGAGAGTATQTVYVYDRGQVLMQFEGEASSPLTKEDLTHRYLWGPAVDQLLADEAVVWEDTDQNGTDDSAANHEVLWTLTDHLGTVRDLVDSAGALQNHKSYDAFGNVTAETNAAKDAVFGFTGKFFDEATGLQNNLNRWYDAKVGGWISEDPIGFAGWDANLYRYVGNGVVGATDPSGEILLGAVAGGILGCFIGYLTDQDGGWDGLISGGIGGAVGGAVGSHLAASQVSGWIAGGLAGGASGLADEATDGALNAAGLSDDGFDLVNVASAAGGGCLVGGFAGAGHSPEEIEPLVEILIGVNYELGTHGATGLTEFFLGK